VRRLLTLVAATLILTLIGGCGDMDGDGGIAKLTSQRNDVQQWARELAARAATALDSPPEDATGSFDGVDKKGPSYDYATYHYVLDADFSHLRKDPIGALAEEFETEESTTSEGSLKLKKGKLSATFWMAPSGQDIVSLEVTGPAVKADHDKLRDWEGYVIDEEVDLGK
jgi:hypothetical protein